MGLTGAPVDPFAYCRFLHWGCRINKELQYKSATQQRLIRVNLARLQ